VTFTAYVTALIGYEAIAIATGRRPPPTITDIVRSLPGLWQLVTAIALIAIPLDHLVTEWLP